MRDARGRMWTEVDELLHRRREALAAGDSQTADGLERNALRIARLLDAQDDMGALDMVRASLRRKA